MRAATNTTTEKTNDNSTLHPLDINRRARSHPSGAMAQRRQAAPDKASDGRPIRWPRPLARDLARSMSGRWRSHPGRLVGTVALVTAVAVGGLAPTAAAEEAVSSNIVLPPQNVGGFDVSNDTSTGHDVAVDSTGCVVTNSAVGLDVWDLTAQLMCDSLRPVSELQHYAAHSNSMTESIYVTRLAASKG